MNISPSFPALVELGGGWHLIESGYNFPGHGAIYVAQCDGVAALFDCGVNASVPLVLAALEQLDIKPEAVECLFISHSHLDHCGGAGQLLPHLPNAYCYTSAKTAQALCAPQALCDGARLIYGDDFERLYGEIIEVPRNRMAILKEGETLKLGSRTLQTIETPGHSFEHLAVIDRTADCIFAGDAFGVFLPPEFELPEILHIPTAPTQFAPDYWKRTVQRLAKLAPERIFVTHYGAISGELTSKATQLCAELDWMIELARNARHQATPRIYIRQRIREHYIEQYKISASEFPENLFALELNICETGLELWMKRHLDSYSG